MKNPVRYASTITSRRRSSRSARSSLCFSRGIFLHGIRACRSYPENKASVARSCRSWLGPRRKGSCSTTVAFTVYTIPNPISSLRRSLRERVNFWRSVTIPRLSPSMLENEITITRDFVARYTILRRSLSLLLSFSLTLSIRPSSLAMGFLNSWKCANF